MNTINHDDAELNIDDSDLDFEPNGTIGDLGAELANDVETSPHYLRAQWIAQTITTLRHARYERGLSQKDVADALGTRQPAIARLERSEDITLGRIWDYLHACGKVPTQLQTVGIPDRRPGPESQEEDGSVVRHAKSG